MIQAECYSDDRRVEVKFDATPWFEQASKEAIDRLKGCGWGGDYPADDVATFTADHNEEVRRMFTYLEIVSGEKDAPGFECHVSEEDATKWLARIR